MSLASFCFTVIAVVYYLLTVVTLGLLNKPKIVATDGE
jgi:hypothetical protein